MHVVHVDLTVVPTLGGLWSAIWPFALPQVWPFCWWVAVLEDQFSRRALGFAVFRKRPTSLQLRTFLGRAFGATGKVAIDRRPYCAFGCVPSAVVARIV